MSGGYGCETGTGRSDGGMTIGGLLKSVRWWAAGAVCAVSAGALGAADKFGEDFDLLWAALRERYAYLDCSREEMARAEASSRAKLAAVVDRAGFLTAVEEVLGRFADAHMNVGTHGAGSPRLVPAGADIWAEWRDAEAWVTQVRPKSPAERAGVRAGDRVVVVGAEPVSEAVARRLEGNLCGDRARAREWALLAVLAGRHGEDRELQVLSPDGTRRTVMLRGEPGDVKRGAPLEARRIGEGGRVGWICFNDSLGHPAAAYAAIAAVKELQDTEALIVDLRDTPSGGNTVVARAILGLFVEREAAYQKHELVEEERKYGVRRTWLELVSPLPAARYSKPVVVLVSRWTGSMGEGLAQGFRAVGRGKVVGSRMAGLRGAISGVTLPKSGFVVQIPTERLFEPDGTPRENFVPDVLVEPEAYAGGRGTGEDAVMQVALKLLTEATARR